MRRFSWFHAVAFPVVALAAALTSACGGSAPAHPPRLSADAELSPGAPERAADRRLLERARLDREALIRAVVARNRSVDAAKHAYRAARARAPQASALPDPMLMYEFAPLSIGSSDVPYGHTIRLSQTLPWPGKLSRREDAARAEADAMREEIEVTKLDLALQASMLYDDYWLVSQSLLTTAEHAKLLREIAASARAKYEVGRGSLQDPLQAEVELTHIEHQELSLKAERDRLRAAINALLHRAPDAPLPRAPDELEVSERMPPPSRELRRQALAARGELRVVGAKRRAAEASSQAAGREYYPDLTLSGAYTTMFMETEHQFMLGVEFPIPIQRGGRAGAVDEANATAAAARSQAEREAIEIESQAEVARLAVVEAIHVVHLYRKRLLPVARDQVKAARSGYQTGANDFQVVVSAQRNLREVELAYLTTLAELSKRRARLQRAIGQLPGSAR